MTRHYQAVWYDLVWRYQGMERDLSPCICAKTPSHSRKTQTLGLFSLFPRNANPLVASPSRLAFLSVGGERGDPCWSGITWWQREHAVRGVSGELDDGKIIIV